MRYTLALVALILMGWLLLGQPSSRAQVRISPTPVRIILPTDAPQALPTAMVLATVTPSSTPTEPPPPMLRAVNPDTADAVNVRAEPDPGAERVGSLEANTTYRVRGRYFSWLQFDYDRSPNGRAWVFESLVTIIGNEAEIPDVDPFATPTPDAAAVALSATLSAPGGAETATADARTIDLPTQQSGPNQPSLGRAGPGLPTFTPPPDIVSIPPTPSINAFPTPTPTPDPVGEVVALVTSGDLPPLVPIVLLMGSGALGMMIGLLRRG